MKKIWQVITIILFGMLAAYPSLAQAQDTYVSVRVEPGVAVPMGNPQEERFYPGFAADLKPELSIFDIFSFGPSLATVVFPSNVDGVDAPALWGLGGFIRFKRPHGFEWNDSEGAEAVSPWIDADAQYVRTGPLDRVGYAVAAGAAWPAENTRMLWVGPFARYQGVHQDDNLVGRNTNDSHTLILGVSVEIGQSMKPRSVKPVEEPAKPVVPTTPVKPEPKPEPVKPAPTYKDVNLELRQVIQFAWDSAKLDATAVKQLDEAVKTICSAKEYKAIKVEGHASSEGQVPHNNKLAQRRADAVVDYLVSKGVSREKLSAVGFGSNVPVASNKNEAGRVLNRRAEFVVNFVIVQEVK